MRTLKSGVFLLVLTSHSVTTSGAEVVYHGAESISTAPFYLNIKRKTDTNSTVSRSQKKRAGYSLEDRLPIRSGALSVGPPRIVEQEHQRPVFIVGGDKRSLQWFAEKAPELAQLRATGIVVALESTKEWSDLQAIARRHRLVIHSVNGDAIAEAYKISSYPTVIMDRRHGR